MSARSWSEPCEARAASGQRPARRRARPVRCLRPGRAPEGRAAPGCADLRRRCRRASVAAHGSGSGPATAGRSRGRPRPRPRDLAQGADPERDHGGRKRDWSSTGSEVSRACTTYAGTGNHLEAGRGQQQPAAAAPRGPSSRAHGRRHGAPGWSCGRASDQRRHRRARRDMTRSSAPEDGRRRGCPTHGIGARSTTSSRRRDRTERDVRAPTASNACDEPPEEPGATRSSASTKSRWSPRPRPRPRRCPLRPAAPRARACRRTPRGSGGRSAAGSSGASSTSTVSWPAPRTDGRSRRGRAPSRARRRTTLTSGPAGRLGTRARSAVAATRRRSGRQQARRGTPGSAHAGHPDQQRTPEEPAGSPGVRSLWIARSGVDQALVDEVRPWRRRRAAPARGRPGRSASVRSSVVRPADISLSTSAMSACSAR